LYDRLMRCFDHVAKPNQLDHGLQLDLVGYTGIHVGGAWNFGNFFYIGRQFEFNMGPINRSGTRWAPPQLE
jgi:hypothetical protein